MEEEKKLTGYPSIDKPWLKYYTEELNCLPDPEMSMYQFLYENNKDDFNKAALEYFGRKISYKQLFDQIDTAANALISFGVKRGDIVSLCALNTPEFVYLLYAVNKIGAVSNWLSPTSSEEDLHEQLVSTESKLVFTVDLAFDLIEKAAGNSFVEKIVCIPIGNSMPFFMRLAVQLINAGKASKEGIQWKDFIGSHGDKADLEIVDPNGMAMIEYTGGSTGTPKGVMLSSKNLNSYYLNFNKANSCGLSNFQSGDKYLACVPLFLAFGVSASCHGPLCHGMELILAPDPKPETLGKLILKSKPNHIAAGRIQIDGFLQEADAAKKNLSFIRSIMYGGEPANAVWEQEIQNALRKYQMTAPVLNGYGMTECSACILIATKDNTNKLLPLGNVTVKITDPDNSSVEFGYDTEGELCLSSDTIMLGYYKNESETDELIFEDGGQRWLKTRDLAVVSSDGFIQITGRIKRIYHKLTSEKVGVRVYPMRIEETISKDPAVEKCAVVGIKDDKTAYRSIAYLIVKDDSENKEKLIGRIDALCKKNLPESHIPDDYVIVKEFPLTRAGKIDYMELEKTAIESKD